MSKKLYKDKSLEQKRRIITNNTKWAAANRDRVLEYRRSTYQTKGKIGNQKRAIRLAEFLAALKEKYRCQNPDCPYHILPLDEHCLEFHHLRDKKFNLGQAVTRSKKETLAEVNKCVILCANCHRLVTWDKLDVSCYPTCDSAPFSYMLDQKLSSITLPI